jgi:polyisoprenoid-binding protein YceI
METQTIWKNDKEHSRLGFTVTHMMINDIVGQFNNFDLTVATSKPDFSDAVFELSADMNSIFTNSVMRDKHLVNADFFETDKYPTLNFKSSHIQENGENTHKVTGELSMHGHTKEVTADFIYRGTLLNPVSNKITSGIQVIVKLKRSDFKVGLILPFDGLKDDVLIKMDGEFSKE